MFDFSFYGLSVYGTKWWVAIATFLRHYFFCTGSVKLLQNLHLLQNFYYYLNFFPLTQRKHYLWKMCNTKFDKHFWQLKRRCSTGTLHFTQCPNFSTTSQTYLSLFLYFSQMTVETWLHFSLTTVRWFWIFHHSWKLEFIALQVTCYKASFMQI